jgi:hypothetical protein
MMYRMNMMVVRSTIEAQEQLDFLSLNVYTMYKRKGC